MKIIDVLKIGKYTFWVSFAIGNIFFLGALYCKAISFWNSDIEIFFVVGGFLYLLLAAIINVLILIALSAICLFVREARGNYLKAIGYILLNIPIAILYAHVGIYFILNL